MTDYGVQDDGTFDRKPVTAIRDDIEQNFLNNLGRDVELRDSDVETQIINATSLELSRQWGAIEGSYFASFYQDAFGVQLDKKLGQVGFQRRPQRGATGEVEFNRTTPATQDYTIPAGTRVNAPETQNRPPIPFQTTESATLSQGSTSVSGVAVEALEVWETDISEEYLGSATNLSADTVTEIVNPITGVESVTNPRPTGTGRQRYTEGQDEETDAEFKSRYRRSFGNLGDATQNAVQAALVDVDTGIVSVDVKEVHDTANDDYGARATVLAPGVGDDVIAQALFDSMALGLVTFGVETGTATDDTGETHTENFERATAFDVEIDVTVTTDDTYSSTADSEITDRLVRYIGGTNTDGETFAGLDIGSDVIFDQVFRRVINQTGVTEATLQIAEKGTTLGTSNLTVGSNKAARVATADITITEA